MKRAAIALMLTLSLSACQTDGVTSLKLFGGSADANAPQIAQIEAGQPAITADAAKRQKDLNAVMLGATGMMSDSGLETYANGVLARLMEQSPRQAPDTHVYILADTSPGAFAYPSGAIFVTQGLFTSLKNEDELAFFLAHELGHVVLGHGQSDGWLKLQRYALMLGETAVSLRYQQKGGKAELPGWLMAGYAGTIVSRDMLSPSRTREEEDEADRIGADLLVKAGYNMNAVGEVIQLMVQAEQEFGRQDAVQLTTLEEALQVDTSKAGNAEGGNNLILQGLNDLMKGIGDAQREARRNHRPPEERLQAMNAYMDRHYAEAPTPRFRQQPLADALANPGTKAVLDNYALANKLPALSEEAQNPKLKSKDRKAATANFQNTLQRLSTAPTEEDNYVRLRVGDYWRTAGKNDLWMKELESARKAPLVSVAVFRQLAAAQEAKGDNAAALAVMEEALKRFDDAGPLFPEVILAARKAGQKDKANSLSLRCRLSAPEFANICARAATG